MKTSLWRILALSIIVSLLGFVVPTAASAVVSPASLVETTALTSVKAESTAATSAKAAVAKPPKVTLTISCPSEKGKVPAFNVSAHIRASKKVKVDIILIVEKKTTDKRIGFHLRRTSRPLSLHGRLQLIDGSPNEVVVKVYPYNNHKKPLAIESCDVRYATPNK
jgi:hypothetical protein